MRLALLATLFPLLAGCGPDLLLPHFPCCGDDKPRRLLRAPEMSDPQLLHVLTKPDRIDLSECWSEAERRGIVRLDPPRDGKHARLVHHRDVTQAVIDRYLAYKRTESEQNDIP